MRHFRGSATASGRAAAPADESWEQRPKPTLQPLPPHSPRQRLHHPIECLTHVSASDHSKPAPDLRS